MCGFIGIYNKNGITEQNAVDGEAMSALISHRGPDLDKLYREGNVFFGFRRLSIIDLEGGSQPFISADNRYACVFNGEIYNYLILRDELIARGFTFKTNSEIEVLVTLFAEYGVSFVSRLRGMFAFMIYDTEAKSLYVFRDPFGIKPLYYREHDGGFTFASEMKAFFRDSEYDGFKVDKALLQHYFTYQYVTEPDTITGDIKILPKGSYMQINDGNSEMFSYFRATFSPVKTPYSQKKTKLRTAIENSVAAHMLSDVPLGSFLSSGIDSAVMTAVASKIAPGIKAFTVGFDVRGYSEIADAAAISSHLDIEHIKLQCDLADFTDNFESVIYHLDSPLGDPSVVAIYLICREAAKHVKVILSGEGSDELFGGYRIYDTARKADRIYRLPRIIKNPLFALAKLLPDSVRGKNFILRGVTPLEKRFVGNSFVFSEEAKRALLPQFDENIHFSDRVSDIYKAASGYTPLCKMQYCDLNTWLPSDILVKGDRLSMAHSLEARVPFLDREVFMAARELRDCEKITKKTTKYILRDTFRDILNEETIKRPKLGYPVPVRVWLKDELYDWARDIINNSTADEFINKNEALRLLELHRTGGGDYYHHVWLIISFITWYKLYVK